MFYLKLSIGQSSIGTAWRMGDVFGEPIGAIGVFLFVSWFATCRRGDGGDSNGAAETEMMEMKLTRNSVDILIGRGPTRNMVEKAALDVLEVRIKEIITENDSDRLIEVEPGGMWVRTMRLDDEDNYGCKLDIDAFRPTDFLHVLRDLQARLGVDLAVPDEESPLPDDALVFRVDGRIDRCKIPD